MKYVIDEIQTNTPEIGWYYLLNIMIQMYRKTLRK